MTSQAAMEMAEKSSTRGAEITPNEGAALITGRQIRMARAALGWSAHELADRTGIGYGAIQRAESAEGMPDMRTRNLAKIKVTLEHAGVVFIDGQIPGVLGSGPGVRLRK
jgi:ribosome-binding protein aMBF1 (putative translation factor)